MSHGLTFGWHVVVKTDAVQEGHFEEPAGDNSGV